MDENLFWHIINDSKNENRQIFINNLIDNLSKFSKDEIYQFEIVLTENMKSLCTWNCFGALITIDTFGCDDAFDDFRSWIISQGKGFFQEFMQNGDSMASEIYRIFESIGNVRFQALQIVSAQALEIKLGNNDFIDPRYNAFLLGIHYGSTSELEGIEIYEADLPKRFPKLWKLFQENP